MRRKIIKQGHNTLTVSLPRNWCDNHSLKDGEEIDISEKGNCLVLSKEAFKGTRSVTVDVTGLDRSTIILLIQSLYTYGYEIITINTKDSKAKYHLKNKDVSMPSIIQYAASRLIGAEIISSSRETYSIQVITEESKEKFDMILRRIFRVMIEMFEAFVERYRKNDYSLIENIEMKHVQLRRFINYALRMLNKYGHEEADKTTYYYSILSLLAKVDEATKNLAGPKDNKIKISRQACDILEKATKEFSTFYEMFYKYDLKKVGEIHKNRDIFRRNLYDIYPKLSKDDVFLLGGFIQVYEIILDLDELKMAIGY